MNQLTLSSASIDFLLKGSRMKKPVNCINFNIIPHWCLFAKCADGILDMDMSFLTMGQLFTHSHFQSLFQQTIALLRCS